MNVTVETGDFRRALRAVAPHVYPDAKMPRLHRVRLTMDHQHVSVSATNTYTAAHAIVSLWDSDGLVDGPLDLTPLDVKQILTIFKGKSNPSDDDPEETLRIETTDDGVVVTDVSGLFAGKSLLLPRTPTEENYPDVAGLVFKHLTRKKSGASRLITSGQLLALFSRAAAAYSQPLVIQPGSAEAAMLLSCGDSFLGLLMPQRPSEDDIAHIDAYHRDWLQRIDPKAAAS